MLILSWKMGGFVQIYLILHIQYAEVVYSLLLICCHSAL